MPNIQQITPKPEIPDWVTETPEPECNWPPYVLMVQGHNGEQEQEVEMTRDEFLTLKRNLAVMRGLPVPKDDDEDEPETESETAPAEVAAPTNGKPAGLITDRMMDEALKDIMNRLQLSPYYREHAHDLSEDRQNGRSEYRADIQLLREILVDWECGSFKDQYPNELPIIAAIKGRLAI